MFEVEMKFRLRDAAAFEDRLKKTFQTNFISENVEEDLYFQRVSRDFRETGEALRIRRVGSDLKITYKGPRLDQVTKMREEIEIPLFMSDSSPKRGGDPVEIEWLTADEAVHKEGKERGREGGEGVESSLLEQRKLEKRLDQRKEEWIRLLNRLGYQPFAVVRKTRRSAVSQFQGRTFNVTSDHLDELGDFVEIETLVESEEGLADARACLIAFAALLELKESVRSSYLSLLLAKTP